MPDEPYRGDEREADRALIARALAGERNAVLALLDRIGPSIRTRAQRVLARCARGRDLRHTLEDVTQQVLLVLFQSNGRVLRTWDPERGLSLRNFVGLVAERQAIGIIRYGRANPFSEDPIEQVALEHHPDQGCDLESEVSARELADALADALRAELTPYAMQMFTLLFVEERTVEEVSRELKLTSDAVYAWRSRLQREVRRQAENLLSEQQRQRSAS